MPLFKLKRLNLGGSLTSWYQSKNLQKTWKGKPGIVGKLESIENALGESQPG